LIEAHLHTLEHFQIEVSSGVVEEVGTTHMKVPASHIRASDVFPMGNTLIRRNVLCRSGLLDLAYERGARADGDLGMRIYLSGVLMILNPEISLLHHHAARGGLRAHKARVITYVSSRKSLVQRHLPSVSEIYLAMRYFTPQQVREMLWLRAFGTFSIRGGLLMKILKIVVSLLFFPETLWKICIRYHEAVAMLEHFPQIETLEYSESIKHIYGHLEYQ
jgi:hypothetical protein